MHLKCQPMLLVCPKSDRHAIPFRNIQTRRKPYDLKKPENLKAPTADTGGAFKFKRYFHCNRAW